MSVKDEISSILPRKIISASISSFLFAILLSLFIPDPFDAGIKYIGEYIETFMLAVPGYLMYSFPVILLYGTITSIISEYLARFIANRTKKSMEFYLSFGFHMLFGLVFLWLSLLAALLYFVTDYILKKKNIYNGKQAFMSLGIPFLVFIIFMGTISIVEMFR